MEPGVCLDLMDCSRQCAPAEQSRGTPRRVSPTLAACAVTTLATWMCSVLDTGSGTPGVETWKASVLAAYSRTHL